EDVERRAELARELARVGERVLGGRPEVERDQDLRDLRLGLRGRGARLLRRALHRWSPWYVNSASIDAPTLRAGEDPSGSEELRMERSEGAPGPGPSRRGCRGRAVEGRIPDVGRRLDPDRPGPASPQGFPILGYPATERARNAASNPGPP